MSILIMSSPKMFKKCVTKCLLRLNNLMIDYVTGLNVYYIRCRGRDDED